MAAVTTIKLSSDHLGLGRISENPAGALERANELLQKNHDEHHIFWRDMGGHNHIPHSVLSVLSMGGGPAEIQRAFDDGVGIMRPLPPLDRELAQQLADPSVFLAHMGKQEEYTSFLKFFEQQITANGWQQTLNEYVFSGTPIAEGVFAQLYDGAQHPLIHLGFGVEFEQPGIMAEALAQASVHIPAGLGPFFEQSEKLAAASSEKPKSLRTLYAELRANDKLRHAARVEDGPKRVREGVFGRAGAEMASLASQYRVHPDQLERGTAEMINICGLAAGGAQRAGKARKIDFFHMHNLNASIFLTAFNRQTWLSKENKLRLVERKARTDLVWYAACAAAELDIEAIDNYKPTQSAGLDWHSLYAKVNAEHDDGHLAKFVRAAKNGELVSRPFESENSDAFPVKGESWFKLAQMVYDTTVGFEDNDKWIWGVGYDPLWEKVPAAE